MIDFEQTCLGEKTLIDHRTPSYPAVRAVVRDERRRVLFIRRREDGGWRMPEGVMEPGESITDCVTRKVQEATGLEVLRVTPLSIYSDPSLCDGTNTSGSDHQLLTINFRIEPGDWFGIPRPDGVETLDARFFAPDDPDLPDVGTVNREVLLDLARFDGRVVVK